MQVGSSLSPTGFVQVTEKCGASIHDPRAAGQERNIAQSPQEVCARDYALETKGMQQ